MLYNPVYILNKCLSHGCVDETIQGEVIKNSILEELMGQLSENRGERYHPEVPWVVGFISLMNKCHVALLPPW